MLRNKFIPIIAILFTLSSCVKLYIPKIKSSDLNKYVVIGQVTMGAQTQTVNVSASSPISDPTYRPVTGCKVTIQDNENHSFPMGDLGNGDYSTMVDPQYLVPGHVFRVKIATPSGDSIVSGYDTLPQVPPVDSISYSVVNKYIPGIGQEQGVQFYINLNGTNADSRYYRWNIYETWEYHAEYPLEYYFDDSVMHHIVPPDSSRYTCWDTRKIPEIYTLSTANLSQNKYKDRPLQYVSTNTNKLIDGYSMLLEQLALSKAAYNFWYQMETLSSQEGGLYAKQPVTIRGNLRDITHPDKEVLGFFSAESASYKRIFVAPIPGLTINYIFPCEKMPIGMINGHWWVLPKWWPCPVLAGPNGPLPWRLQWVCVNCLLSGGTTVKPSFWPN